MSKEVLITGAGGYIGTTLVPMLLMAGYRVRAVDTWWLGQHIPAHPALSIITADVRETTPEIFADVDAVVDLAALSNDPCGDAFSSATRSINHHARRRTAEMARQAGARHYVLASSCSVYGSAKTVLGETSDTRPLTVYAEANLDAEKDTLSLATPAFRATALRFATLFGVSPRMRLDLVVNGMAYNAWRHGEIAVDGSGAQMRPLLHVRDAAEAIFRTLKHADRLPMADIMNVGNPQQNISINDISTGIAEQLRGICGKAISIRHRGPQDLRSYVASFNKLHATLAWLPSRAWQPEIARIVSYLKHASADDLRSANTLDYYRDMISKGLIDANFATPSRSHEKQDSAG